MGWLAALLPMLMNKAQENGKPGALQAPQVGGGMAVPPVQQPKQSGFMNMLGGGAQACMGMNPPAFCSMMKGGGAAGATTPSPSLGASDLAGTTAGLG